MYYLFYYCAQYTGKGQLTAEGRADTYVSSSDQNRKSKKSLCSENPLTEKERGLLFDDMLKIKRKLT